MIVDPEHPRCPKAIILFPEQVPGQRWVMDSDFVKLVNLHMNEHRKRITEIDIVSMSLNDASESSRELIRRNK